MSESAQSVEWRVFATVIDGEEFVVVLGADNAVAFPRWCPHQQADLAMGSVFRGALKCPHHGFMFNIESGRGVNCRYDVVSRRVELVGEEWKIIYNEKSEAEERGRVS